MKILYVIDHLAFGGGQMSLKTIVENMTDDVECVICTLRDKANEVPISVPIVRLNCGKYNPFAFIQIAKLCKKQNIDILHPQLDKSIILCLMASFFCKSKVVIHERGGIALLKGFASFLYRVILRILHNRASAIIANSNAMASELHNKAGINIDSIKVIHNPVDFKIMNLDNVPRTQARDNLNIKKDDFVIGYVGRLHYIKGSDILLEAFDILSKKSSKYLLVLAGDGPQRESLEQISERSGLTSRVRFLGMCNNIPEIITTFNIGIVPSRRESFGRVAVELMRMKIPVISSGVDGLSEIIEDNITGIITKENTPSCIAEAIENLAANSSVTAKIVDNAFTYSEQFNVDEHIKKIKSVYLEVLN